MAWMRSETCYTWSNWSTELGCRERERDVFTEGENKVSDFREEQSWQMTRSRTQSWKQVNWSGACTGDGGAVKQLRGQGTWSRLHPFSGRTWAGVEDVELHASHQWSRGCDWESVGDPDREGWRDHGGVAGSSREQGLMRWWMRWSWVTGKGCGGRSALLEARRGGAPSWDPVHTFLHLNTPDFSSLPHLLMNSLGYILLFV